MWAHDVMAKSMVAVKPGFAEAERELLRIRRRRGIEVARADDQRWGRRIFIAAHSRDGRMGMKNGEQDGVHLSRATCLGMMPARCSTSGRCRVIAILCLPDSCRKRRTT